MFGKLAQRIAIYGIALMSYVYTLSQVTWLEL